MLLLLLEQLELLVSVSFELLVVLELVKRLELMVS